MGIDFGAITDDAEAVAAAKAKGVELAEAAEKTWGNALNTHPLGDLVHLLVLIDIFFIPIFL